MTQYSSEKFRVHTISAITSVNSDGDIGVVNLPIKEGLGIEVQDPKKPTNYLVIGFIKPSDVGPVYQDVDDRTFIYIRNWEDYKNFNKCARFAYRAVKKANK